MRGGDLGRASVRPFGRWRAGWGEAGPRPHCRVQSRQLWTLWFDHCPFPSVAGRVAGRVHFSMLVLADRYVTGDILPYDSEPRLGTW